MKLHENDPWVMHFQNTSKILIQLNSMKNSGCHGNWKKKTLKIFLSQTVRARAFIFGMYHHVVVSYQNTSNYGPGVEISPMLWGLRFHKEIKKEIFKNLLGPNHKG